MSLKWQQLAKLGFCKNNGRDLKLQKVEIQGEKIVSKMQKAS